MDQIKKIGPEHFRVDESKETLDDEGGSKRDSEADDDGDKDNFDKLGSKKNWKYLFKESHLWQKNFEVKVEDIDRIKFLGLNLNTNPPILKLRVFLYDGSVINVAFMAISRELGLKFKNYNSSAYIDINSLTLESSIWLNLPKDENLVDDEITRISKSYKERTFSQTFKMLISKKTWIEKLGIKDHSSKQVNNEVMWVYLTVFIVLSVILFGVIYLLV